MGLNESFVFRAWCGFSFAGAKHHQKKSLITFLAIFGVTFLCRKRRWAVTNKRKKTPLPYV